jgi:hypothetical protein
MMIKKPLLSAINALKKQVKNYELLSMLRAEITGAIY